MGLRGPEPPCYKKKAKQKELNEDKKINTFSAKRTFLEKCFGLKSADQLLYLFILFRFLQTENFAKLCHRAKSRHLSS